MDFVGATALVTGGGSGIGRALGAALRRSGAEVTLADIAPPDADCRTLDVLDETAFRALVDDVGPVDLLVSCAGISFGGPTHEMSAAHWERIIDVNIRGVVNGVRAVYPSMIERGRGQIVNVASGAGLAPPPFVTAYASREVHAILTSSPGEPSLHGGPPIPQLASLHEGAGPHGPQEVLDVRARVRRLREQRQAAVEVGFDGAEPAEQDAGERDVLADPELLRWLRRLRVERPFAL